MERESRRMRGNRPFFFTNFRAGKGIDEIAHFIEEKGGLGPG
jgi:urease accessory protein